MDGQISIVPTVAFDDVENVNDLYDGFYETSESSLTSAAKLESVVSAAHAKDERQRRLVDSIKALNQTMAKASTINFTKLLNASIEEEQKRKAEELAVQIAEAEKLMAGKKRQIQIAMSFLSIGEVDAFKETFAAEVIISALWREPALDSWSDAKLKDINYDAFFNPNLYVDNLIVERRTTITNNIFRNDKNETFMIEKTSLRGVFGFTGTLRTFPFDVQDLGVTLTTDLSITQVELVPSEEELSQLKIRLSVDQLSQTWHLHGHIDMQLKTIRSEMTGAAVDRPALEIMARVARETKYYWYNMYAIVFFLMLTSTFTFFIDAAANIAAGTSISARLHLCIMVFLNVISYKIAVSITMPKLSFLTVVDKYIIYNIITLEVLTFFYAAEYRMLAQPMVVDATTLRGIDRYGMIGSIGLYFLWNAVYFLWIRFSVCAKRYEADHSDSAWKKWMKKKLAWQKYKSTKTY